MIFNRETRDSAAAIPAPLLAWYDQNKREMAWRDAHNSYYTWVSEIMLQQTRVEAVRAYFDRFIAALPTLRDLAACDEETLLKLWEGLGYYNRARNLQKAAKLVVERHGGELPRDYEQLLALPGIGEYTAGAIASIAYGIPAPCVDGNVMRVLSRVTANCADITLPAVKRDYQALARELIPAGRAGDFNQALMELGALVCLPNGLPLCGGCPLAELCAAHRAGCELDYPVKPPKPERRIEEKTVCVLVCGELVYLQKRPEGGLLAGLWEFWNRPGHLSRDELCRELERDGLAVRSMHTLKKAKHIFTHIEWRMQGYLAYAEQPIPLPGGEWISLPQLREGHALPGALRAYSADLERWVQSP
ncbi:A/G-specific adenine glycosylase [Clostridiaceae bacterium NSJ-31]|uniref:Adenine DNA glycosylase n=1 Tax=Ligaoa zhengdingensis TaxID=2763658 RepID=A0A926I3T2_9FIRM|nr:A/G-specific adenine glycosylase [Ligaoa zhengdingensis]MBC8545838.1 A/G-specific adenine glycosylase [Ligaoa zhengdingensis]